MNTNFRMPFDSRITKNFVLSEFFQDLKTFQECEERYIQNVVVVAEILQIFRNKKNLPINVSSGFRTFQQNKDCGGTPHSFHKFGLACDFWYKDIEKTFSFDFEHLKGLFNGVIWYPDKKFFHVDIGNREYYRL